MTGLLKQLSVGAQDDLRGAVKERLRASRGGIDGIDGGSRLGGGNNDPPGGGLGDGVLEKNLGVPMVVVGCKADSLQSETFEQQQRLHFIQQSLRRFCLKCEPRRGRVGIFIFPTGARNGEKRKLIIALSYLQYLGSTTSLCFPRVGVVYTKVRKLIHVCLAGLERVPRSGRMNEVTRGGPV